MHSAHLHIVILAAGNSSRLGQPKQLVNIVGKPALQHVVGNATAVSNSVSVVLGAQAADISRLLQHSSASVLINRQWQEGIAASIRCGVANAGAADALLVLLGDQVAVSAGDLRRLIAAWNGQDSVIAAASYQGQLGAPAIFPRFAFADLAQLRGDQGAKVVINRYLSRTNHVPMPNAALDLDTPDDVQAMQRTMRTQDKEVLL